MSKPKKPSRTSSSPANKNNRAKAREIAKKSGKKAMTRGKVAHAREALDLQFASLRETKTQPTSGRPQASAVVVDDLTNIMNRL